jgi:molybdopterin converting factor small subunit
VRLLLFASAREAAGRSRDEFDLDRLASGDGEPQTSQPVTLAALLIEARSRYGPAFAAVLDTARVWINGDEPAAGLATDLVPGDEIAVLPPVSGGAAGS